LTGRTAPQAKGVREGTTTLLLIALFKLLKGILLVAVGIGAVKLLHRDVADIRSVGPHTRVGIEGAQMPGWGGYARLTSTLDAMEPYDIGDNTEIIRSLNPHIAS